MELTPDQLALRDAVRGLLARHQDDDGGGWPRLAREIGVAGLAIPEAYGGAGAGPVETHIVLEELGRGLTTSPMLGSAVLATRALLATGDDAACGRLLPGLAAGTSTAALAWTGPDGHWDPARVACRASAEASLTGQAHYVLDGAGADVLLVAAESPDGIALFELDPAQPGVTRTPVITMDQTRHLATVSLDNAPGRRLGSRLDLALVRDLACIALSAEQVGAAGQALAETVAYTKVREQFGRPIGGFQGLQHRLADLHVLVCSARSLSYSAAEAAADGEPGLDLRAAAARTAATEALTRTAAEMIQLHGAIGITWEHDAHRYFKRAHGDSQLLGPPAGHLARIAAALLDHG
jgi:hypothetical protein